MNIIGTPPKPRAGATFADLPGEAVFDSTDPEGGLRTQEHPEDIVRSTCTTAGFFASKEPSPTSVAPLTTHCERRCLMGDAAEFWARAREAHQEVSTWPRWKQRAADVHVPDVDTGDWGRFSWWPPTAEVSGG